MKVQYLILLVAVALEAGLSVWPEGSFVAAANGETVVVKPATRKGKSPKKIKRTIRVREAKPAAPAVASAAPVQSVPQQQAAPVAQPISNEINVKPDISVHVAPQQQQQHHPQQQQAQPVVQIQQQQQPDGGKQLVVPHQQQQQQQPIVELPDDDDDDNDDDNHNDVDDDGDDRQVKAENMQIVPYEQPEQSIAPVDVEEQELQIVPRSNPAATELVDVGSEQMKKMLLGAGDLVPQWPYHRGAQSDDQLGLAPISDGAHPTDPNNTYLNANNIINRRYTPLGWPMSPMNVLATGYPSAFAQGQIPMIQVNIDEQLRRPWLSAPAPTMQIQSPYVSAPYAASAPIWQQPAAASFYPASPVGATLPAAAAVYPGVAGALGPALVEAPRVSAYYGGMPAAMGQPMFQAQPVMMAPPMVQQQPIMVQPAVMMQPIFATQPAEMKIKKKKAKKQQVVEIEEPAVEEKTTWVKKEPQFNQYVEETKPAAAKIVEVKKEKVEQPEEIEWETVRIPKIKNAAAAAGQQ